MGEATKAKKDVTTFDEWMTREHGPKGSPERTAIYAGAFTEYVGALIQEYRETHLLTQAELADRLGVKKSYLSRIENGRADLRASTLMRILNGIGFQLGVMPV